jgi:NTP pyrophosphatase (non-canonical NTP hydrolase)
MSDFKAPFNQTPMKAEVHNWPSPHDKYAHSACFTCGEGFFGPKHVRHCHLCCHQHTAPVPELQDLPYVPALEGPHVYKPTHRIAANGKFISTVPLPTPYERELLTILIEECAEVAQRATKMLRFGVMEVQEGQKLTNAERLSDETGDLECLITMCADEGLMVKSRIHDAHRKKWAKLEKYMQTAKDTPA